MRQSQRKIFDRGLRQDETAVLMRLWRRSHDRVASFSTRCVRPVNPLAPMPQSPQPSGGSALRRCWLWKMLPKLWRKV